MDTLLKLKEIESFPQTLIFLSFYLCNLMSSFLTKESVTSNNMSLKYQRFTPSGCKDKGIKKYEFVAKTHFKTKELNNALQACPSSTLDASKLSLWYTMCTN